VKGLREPGRKIFKVSDLAGKLNDRLAAEFSEVWVQGEITGFTRHKSGHLFFSLKDEKAKLEVVMFRFQALYLKFAPGDGLEALVRGRLNFYEPRGELRMIADALEPVGVGALQLAFEQLRARLEAEGLFSKERKRPIPAFCRRIAVITSETGAVFQDMLRVFKERGARLSVLLIPSRVQGERAELELAEAIGLANRAKLPGPALDAIVLARGGGSLEDLWPFNTEHLARAIYKSRLPVISAVGHEVDYTISDMVADLRALTPTAAAEFLASSQRELISRLEIAADDLQRSLVSELRLKAETIKKFLMISRSISAELGALDKEIEFKKFRLGAALNSGLQLKKESWRELSRSLLLLSPAQWLQQNQERLVRAESDLSAAVKKSLGRNREEFMHLSGRLHTLSPLSTLARGYSITLNKKDRKPVKSVQEVKKGDMLEILLHKGELEAKVENTKATRSWEDHDKSSEDDPE
jgi:exodeoxyribonuclease VII large subunit